MGFSESLSDLEKAIIEENFDKANEKFTISMEIWEKVKPFMQIEVDHDIVNDIESEFAALSAYIYSSHAFDRLTDLKASGLRRPSTIRFVGKPSYCVEIFISWGVKGFF